MTKAVDAIALAALRAPQQRERPEQQRQKRPRRRRMRLNLGRFAFTSVVLYLVGTGIVGEVQLLNVQAQLAKGTRQFQALNSHNAQLSQEVRFYRSPAGEKAAIQGVLRYAPQGETVVQISHP